MNWMVNGAGYGSLSIIETREALVIRGNTLSRWGKRLGWAVCTGLLGSQFYWKHLVRHTPSCNESVLSDLEVVVLLLCADSQFVCLKRSELAAVGTGLLLTEVVRSVLVLFVSLSGNGNAFLRQDGQHASDCLAYRADLGQLDRGWEETLDTRRAARSLRCLVSSSVRDFSSFFLSSWALTLCICLI